MNTFEVRVKSQSQENRPAVAGLFSWLGMRDSNPRMLVPETSALPLGESPKLHHSIIFLRGSLVIEKCIDFFDSAYDMC